MVLNHRGFDEWAKDYDQSVRLSEGKEAYPFAGYQDVINLVYHMAGHKPSSTILDVGFGTGTLTKRLYDDGHNIYGIDFSKEMIAIAKGKMPNANLFQKNMEEGLPFEFEKEKFHTIISTYALHHVTDRKKIEWIQQLSFSLHEGGSIIIGDIAFETRSAHDQCKNRSYEDWDHSEFYTVYEEIKEELIALKFKVDYKQISHCGGVLLVRR
ncbi:MULTISPECIES: class I SAM-dependent methyltransferase [Cytobacillus]|uniref:Methyltransferase domain-containing protein n=1 Tax=Cytobacillus kochii TaxID=859143 RepID=A0A248TF13_9BACI|nr:class I SAM-dependent methyltransferase [Cytobacillus kochii]ASV66700.1 hypothetical protein CKF48_04815 [Cytobacillus kochii]